MKALRLTLICGVLGLVTTIALAWWSAATVDFSQGAAMDITLDVLNAKGWPAATSAPDAAELWTTPTAVRREWMMRMPGYRPLLDRGRTSYHPWQPFAMLQRWGSVPGLGVQPPPSAVDGQDNAFGWPFLALWYEYALLPTRSEATPGGIRFDSASGEVRALPWRPIWSGIIVDTAFFALAWTPLVLLAGAGRRRAIAAVRRRRGLCGGCGYDLRGVAGSAVCPECGVQRAGERAAVQERATP